MNVSEYASTCHCEQTLLEVIRVFKACIAWQGFTLHTQPVRGKHWGYKTTSTSSTTSTTTSTTSTQPQPPQDKTATPSRQL
ncbi:hypothetical protein E2C01_076282 [Portunus trituberculatus]|uniref:Uncharacterized protein n=1 Tax=Portunus trituberculatus TaxID=210409 RepID=A0A5B7IN75_PORTR|nr:hypothetical protein [Portunus trituberculatus]